MAKLSKKIEPYQKKLVKVVAIKDLATSKIKSVVNKGKALGKMTFAPVVKLNDKLSSGISKAKSKLKSLSKSIAIPVTVAATVGAVAIGGAVKSGMELEQQKVSMEHFIGTTNKGMSSEDVKKLTEDFTQELRNNANSTPFETGDVISAGSRAVAITGGNTNEAMDMVKLAEDMSASSGGTKTISDAMEALADAKMGEMERLKEFGFKVSAEEFKSKGYEGIASDLDSFFGGASEKLANTGAGLLSTITGKLKSNFADFGLGVVEQLKPTFESIIKLIDKTTPMFNEFGLKVVDGIGKGINAVIEFAPTFKAIFNELKPVFSSLMTSIMPIVTSIKNMFVTLAPIVAPHLRTFIGNITMMVEKISPIVSGIIDVFTVVAEALYPVLSKISDSVFEKLGAVADIVADKMPFIKEVFNTTMPIVADVLSVAWSVISPIIDLAISAFGIFADVVEAVFPAVRDTISSVWEFLKPIFEGLSDGLTKFADGASSVKDKFKDWLGIGGETTVTTSVKGGTSPVIGKNAKGTNNWRGGLSWVGEEGPELVDLPRGSRVLPNKESMNFAKVESQSSLPVPSHTNIQRNRENVSRGGDVNITIPKLADNIIIREDADIDKIGETIVKKIKKAKLNLA